MSAASSARTDRVLVLQCVATALVAVGAAYASYRHGRAFALRFGADPATAVIWPLIVDGLLVVATVELWRSSRQRPAGGRWVAWLSFALGIGMSLCANIAAAPHMNVLAVTVAACPPLALLLAVELLNGALRRRETPTAFSGAAEATDTAAPPTPPDAAFIVLTAEQRMWNHYQRERREGRLPSGAELDRMAGTNNYGRRVLQRWRASGRIALQER